MKMWDFECEKCGLVEERLVRYGEEQFCACEEGAAMVRKLSAPVCWMVDSDRTNAQLKERSERHTAEMRRRGYDPVSQNKVKTRKKNRNHGVVEKKLQEYRSMKAKGEL